MSKIFGKGPSRIKSRPFDWFIPSVLGYLCCCGTGICAMYYAVRANYAVEWERDPEQINGHIKKAKYLTIASIIAGGVSFVIFMIVVIVVSVQAATAVSAADKILRHRG